MPMFFCRVTKDEETKFKSLLFSDGAGCDNIGEMLRLLLHREYNRRHNLPKPKATDWQTTLRPKPGRKPNPNKHTEIKWSKQHHSPLRDVIDTAIAAQKERE